MQITVRNLLLGLRDQGPLSRFIKNLFKGHILGLFHPRSHFRDTGQEKVSYNTKTSAQKAADAMSKKKNVHFSNYKCIYCDGYHLGKNQENRSNLI